MSNLIKVKDEEQKKALNSWAKRGFVGSIIAGTGWGKSRAGVLAVSKTLSSSDTGQALVLVPTTQLQKQFEEEFIKWGHEAILNRVEIICYQSAYKFKKKHYSIVVCDEVHMGLSPEYRKFFENNSYDKLLCMTATLPEELEYQQHLQGLAPTAYTITLDECVELGLVSPYNIICVPVTLTAGEQVEYKKINNRFVYWKMKLGMDAFTTAKYILANKNANNADRQAATQFYKAIRDRKKVVDFASSKLKALQEIVKKNTDKKILVFGGANAFTDQLCDAVQPFAMAYHSKKTAKQKKLALESFKKGKINVLCSTKALNQGFDVPDASVGVICGLTSKGLTMIQRVGRLIRFQKGKQGQVIVLYVKDSQEEKWLQNSVKSLKNIKWIKNVKKQ